MPPTTSRSVAPGDLLSTVVASIPGGEDRPSQREMVEAVHDAFTTNRHLAVQGPTGVGKSLAYLLPAVTAAAAGERTVVVTSSRALQDQLAEIELPFLAEVLDVPFQYAVLKGRSNYLCEAAASEVRVQLRGGSQQSFDMDGPATTSDELADEELVAEVETILDWAETTASGDLAELPFTPHWKAWGAVSVGPGECVGAARCSYAEECWSERARERAESAQIVVVNAHLYGAHIQTGRTLLPPHTQLVIDEAHEFEDSIVGSLSIEMTAGRLSNLARVHDRCVAGDEIVAKSLRSAADTLEASLQGELVAVATQRNQPGGTQNSLRLHDGPGVALSGALASALSASDRALNSLRVAAKNAGESSARHRIDRAVRTAESTVNDCQALLGKVETGTVCWVETTRSDRHAVRLTRIDVAATLRKRAWEDDELTVVCCSATLDPGTAKRLGLDARFVSVDSPFNFRDNALLYVPKIAASEPTRLARAGRRGDRAPHPCLQRTHARALHLELDAARHRRTVPRGTRRRVRAAVPG